MSKKCGALSGDVKSGLGAETFSTQNRLELLATSPRSLSSRRAEYWAPLSFFFFPCPFVVFLMIFIQ